MQITITISNELDFENIQPYQEFNREVIKLKKNDNTPVNLDAGDREELLSHIRYITMLKCNPGYKPNFCE